MLYINFCLFNGVQRFLNFSSLILFMDLVFQGLGKSMLKMSVTLYLLNIPPSPSMVMYREIVEYLLTSGASLLPHDTVTKRTPLHAAGNQFATLIGNKTHACLFVKSMHPLLQMFLCKPVFYMICPV